MPTSLYLTARQPAKQARLLDLASSHTGLAYAYLAVANTIVKGCTLYDIQIVRDKNTTRVVDLFIVCKE